jgi:hypothetical protein
MKLRKADVSEKVSEKLAARSGECGLCGKEVEKFNYKTRARVWRDGHATNEIIIVGTCDDCSR